MKRASLFVAALLILVGCVVNLKSERVITIIHTDVECNYPGKSELNTFEGYYRKEISPGHYAQTKITLDPGQQLLILNKAIVLHFFDMPAVFRHSVETDTQTHVLRIRGDTAKSSTVSPLDHTISWRGSINGLLPNNYHPDQLYQYIDSILRSTDEYQALPESR